MAQTLKRKDQNEDLRRPLLSHEVDQNTEEYRTFTYDAESTGYTKELRFIILGGNEALMDQVCNVILGQRGETIDSGMCAHRKGCVAGKMISLVKMPSNRMSKLAAFCSCCSEVKSIKDQMLNCVSQVFPGPHAFLLVTDNRQATKKENSLLKALSKMFGKESLDYVMVVFVGETIGNYCIGKYVNRFVTLENTDESVESLFQEIKRMTRYKESKFFIQSSYENLMKKAFLSWEKERFTQMKETEENLRKEIVDKEIQHVKEVDELKETLRLTESNLKKDMDTLKCLMLDTFLHLKSKDSQSAVEAGSLSDQESPFNVELEACKDSETTLRNMFSEIVDELKTKLKASEESVITLRSMYSSAVDDWIYRENGLKSVNEKLQKEVEQLKARKGKLEQKLKEAEDRVTHIKLAETDLTRRETDPDRENKLENSQKDLQQRKQHIQSIGSEHELYSSIKFMSPGLPEDKVRSLEEGEREMKSRDEELQASGSSEFEAFTLRKRLGSINIKRPNISEKKDGKDEKKEERAEESEACGSRV